MGDGQAWLVLATSLVVACAPEPAPQSRPESPPATSSTSCAAPPSSARAGARPEATGTLRDGEAVLAPLADRWAEVLDHAPAHRLQLLISTSGGERYSYRADAEYFYPASAIKPFAAIAAWSAAREGLGTGEGEIVRCDVAAPCRRFSHRGRHPTLRHAIRDALAKSDNVALGWLFDLVGRDAIQALWSARGYTTLRFFHRMGESAHASRRATIRLGLRRGPRLWRGFDGEAAPLAPLTGPGLAVGRRHDARGARHATPMSFAQKNRVSLAELHRLLGDLESEAEPLAVVRSAMTRRPAPTRPDRGRPDLPLVASLGRACPGTERIVGKSGAAYGFVVDNGYVARETPPRRIYVSAVLYADADGVVNDDRYDYHTTSGPFLADLGRALAARFCVPPDPRP